MKVRKFALLLVSTAGLMVLGSAAAYADGAAAPDAVQAAPATDQDKMVCKSMEPTTGSRLGAHRECHTQKEWDDRMRRAQEETQRQQASGFHSGSPNN